MIFEKYQEFEFNGLYKFKDQMEYIKSHRIVNWDLILKNESIYEDVIDYYIDNFDKDKLSNLRFSQDFIEEHKDKLDLKILQRHNIFSEEFMKKHEDELSINLIISKQRISERYITELMNKFDFISKIDVVSSQILSEEFLENNQELIKYSFPFQKLSEKFIEKHIEIIKEDSVMDSIIEHQEVSEEFIQKNIIYFNIEDVLYYKILSEEFMIRNIELIKREQCMMHLIRKQKLSEDFIESYVNKSSEIEWYELILNQNLSEGFIEKNYSKIEWKVLSKNVVIDEKIIEKYKDKLIFDVVIQNRKLSKSFWDKNEEISDNNIGLMTAYQYCNDKFLERNINSIKEKQLVNSSRKKITIKYLSENSIKKYKNELNMFVVLSNNSLSEEFIEKEIIEIGLWYEISKYQKLSEEFIKKYEDKINFNLLSMNEHVKVKSLGKFSGWINMNFLRGQNTKVNLKERQEENEKNFRIYKIFDCNEELLNKNGLYVNKEVKDMINRFENMDKNILNHKYIEKDLSYLENKIKRNDRKEKIIEKRREGIKKREEKKRREIKKREYILDINKDKNDMGIVF